jgi:hypothetical protein
MSQTPETDPKISDAESEIDQAPNGDIDDLHIAEMEYIGEGANKKLVADGRKQMELFASVTSDEITNAIHLYDAAPKYTYDQKEFDVSVSAFEEKSMTLGGEKYEVQIQAARIQRADGTEVLIKPGVMEECIEDSLRKLATSGNGVFINGDAGVKFSLYQLKTDLETHGHTYSYAQLREGLEVMRRSGLKITDPRSGESWEEGFLVRLVKGGRRTSEKGPIYEQWYASFHLLVTKSILNFTYRQMNYPLMMSIPGQLSKFLFKRMSLVYTQASSDNPYQPTMNQILSESGRGFGKAVKNDIKAVTRAFDQLKAAGVILEAEETKRVKQGNKVVNIHYNLYPSQKFIQQTIDANKRSKEVKGIAGRQKMRDLKHIISPDSE